MAWTLRCAGLAERSPLLVRRVALTSSLSYQLVDGCEGHAGQQCFEALVQLGGRGRLDGESPLRRGPAVDQVPVKSRRLAR